METAVLDQKVEEFKAKEAELKTIIEEAGNDVDFSQVVPFAEYFAGGDREKGQKEALTEFQRLNKAQNERGEDLDRMRAVKRTSEDQKAREDLLNEPQRGKLGWERGLGGLEGKSFSELVIASPAIKNRMGNMGPEAKFDLDFKALFRTGAGFAPQAVRTGEVVMYPTKPLDLIDLVVTIPTNQSAVSYMRQTSRSSIPRNVTEATDLTAAGELWPEATLVFTPQSAAIEKIATYVPVTDEQLEDEPGIQGILENDLEYMLRERLTNQILNGNGTSPNLDGILATTGIGTTAIASSATVNIADETMKAITDIEAGNTNGLANGLVDLCVYNPNDWEKIRMLKDKNGNYIWGHPSEAGIRRIWGRSVVTTPMLAENTLLVGDFGNFYRLRDRRDVRVQYSNSHSDYFVRGVQAIRADVRVASTIMRPAAFHSVTNLNAA